MSTAVPGCSTVVSPDSSPASPGALSATCASLSASVFGGSASASLPLAPLLVAAVSPPPTPVSMRASTTPTSTVVPTSTRISLSVPDAGDSTSVSILSVEIEQMISSRSTLSPTAFFHSTTVPSATETPIWGIVTST